VHKCNVVWTNNWVLTTTVMIQTKVGITENCYTPLGLRFRMWAIDRTNMFLWSVYFGVFGLGPVPRHVLPCRLA
jgi:hypothetical protein